MAASKMSEERMLATERAFISKTEVRFAKRKTEISPMDAMNLLGLTCAVLAALAFGVLLAYSCCQALFAMLRMHSRSLQPGSQNNAVEAQVQAS
jgi:nucleoside permease NupC